MCFSQKDKEHFKCLGQTNIALLIGHMHASASLFTSCTEPHKKTSGGHSLKFFTFSKYFSTQMYSLKYSFQELLWTRLAGKRSQHQQFLIRGEV